MKEHSLQAGGRRWFGTDYIELQKESLDAVTALVRDYAPCILSGGVVSVDGGDVMSVTAGFAVLKDSAGVAHIVRFPASTPIHIDYHPRWLTLDVAPIARLYDDNQTREVAKDYTAQWAATQQTPRDLEFAGATGVIPRSARLIERVGAAGPEAVEIALNGTHVSGNSSLSIYYRVNLLTRMVYARGSLTVANAQGISTVYNCPFASTALPAELEPASEVYFSYHRRVHSVSPEKALELSLPIPGKYKPGGTDGFCASPTKPADPTIASYTAYFNVSWPMQ